MQRKFNLRMWKKTQGVGITHEGEKSLAYRKVLLGSSGRMDGVPLSAKKRRKLFSSAEEGDL